MARRRGPKAQEKSAASGRMIVDRNEQDRRNGSDRRGLVEIHSTVPKADKDRLFDGVSRGYALNGPRHKYPFKGYVYKSRGELKLAKVLDKAHILFKPHIILPNCPNQEDPAVTHDFELDFVFMEREKFPGMSELVNGLEFRGVVDDHALMRHAAITFKYGVRIRTAYEEHVDLWERLSLKWPARVTPINPSQPNKVSQQWIERMAHILNIAGVQYKRDVRYRRIIEPWASGKYRTSQFFNITADFVPKHPIKIRGFSPYIDGIIVRTRFERDDLEALHILRGEPYHLRFIIAVPTSITSWYNGGLLSPDRMIRILKGV